MASAMKTHSNESWRLRAVLLFAIAAIGFGASPAVAQSSVPDAVRQEARQRFDAGLEAYDAGDFEGALAEFERAYELTAHPLVLYNLGLVHAGRGDSVASVEALEKLLAAPSNGLDPDETALARSTLQAQSAKLGAVKVTTTVSGARLQVDGLDVSALPGERIRLRAGVHQVAVLAPGFAPSHQRVTVASGSLQTVSVTMEPLDEALAHLTITSNVADASVIVNDTLMGKTPLPSSLAFRPGRYRIRMERVGYRQQERVVDLQPGGTGSLSLPMFVDLEARPDSFGELRLSISEPNAVVLLDGQPAIAPARGVRLPVGRHHLAIRRDGFYDVEREVIVEASTALQIELLPRPSYLRDYVESANQTRTWAWIAGGVGAVAIGSGTGFLIWNGGEKDVASRAFEEQKAIATSGPTGMCDSKTCEDLVNIRLNRLKETRGRDKWGYLTVGVGAAALGTGVALFLIGDDPERYAPTPESDVFGSLRLDVASDGLSLRGRF